MPSTIFVNLFHLPLSMCVCECVCVCVCVCVCLYVSFVVMSKILFGVICDKITEYIGSYQ